jgi:molybdopterin converting factor small subunit
MKIVIHGFLGLHERLALPSSLDLPEGATLKDLLEGLPPEIKQAVEAQAIDPRASRAGGRLAILINGRHFTHLPDRLETRLADQDEVAIFPPIAGG